jgi:NAD(P)-dependent dehydrogenase (short-subunit alcohol dehydrogenase family)
MTKVAVVTGSSSGIGYETSLLLARNQFTTYATMRNINKSDRLREIALKENIHLNVTQLDVNSDSSVDDAIENVVKYDKQQITEIYRRRLNYVNVIYSAYQTNYCCNVFG